MFLDCNSDNNTDGGLSFPLGLGKQKTAARVETGDGLYSGHDTQPVRIVNSSSEERV
jgi:hypothetical protein